MKSLIRLVRDLIGEISGDRVMLVAAGCTFYLLLALFPLLAALVSLYGLVASPVAMSEHLELLAGFLPESGLEIIRTQLDSLVASSTGGLSLTFVGSLLVTLWSANGGIKTLFEAMNVAYGRTEQRSFVKLSLLTLGFTLGTIVLIVLLVVMIGVVPAVLDSIGLGRVSERLLALSRWPVLLALLVGGIGVLYRFGPTGARPAWREVLPGALFAAAAWIVASLGFSWYLANFADYNATYGSLGAVIGLLMWTWISMTILIAGAELNALLASRRESRRVTIPASGPAQHAVPPRVVIEPAREGAWLLFAAAVMLLLTRNSGSRDRSA